MQSNLSTTVSVMKCMMNINMCRQLGGFENEVQELAVDALLDVQFVAYQRGQEGDEIGYPTILDSYIGFKAEWDRSFKRGMESADMATCSYCQDDTGNPCPIHD